MKLLGWQRLYIVFSIIYLIVITFITIHEIPTESKLQKEKNREIEVLMRTKSHSVLTKLIYGDARDNIYRHPTLTEFRFDASWMESIKNQCKMQLPNYPQNIIDIIRLKIEKEERPPYGGRILAKKLNAEQIVEFCQEINEKIIAINTDYEQRIRNLYTEHMKFIGFAILVWIIPVVFIYILGLIIIYTIKWIAAGFKQQG